MERWKIHHPTGVKVSNMGRVKNRRGRLLPGTPGRLGHLSLTLYEGKSVTYGIHKLVAMLWIGPCPEGYQVNHKDGNPSNNAVSNLEYCTRKENMQYSFQVLGRPGNRRPKKNPCPEVLAMFAQGMRGKDIAKIMGISETTVSYIKLGKHWGVSPTGYHRSNFGKSHLTKL